MNDGIKIAVDREIIMRACFYIAAQITALAVIILSKNELVRVLTLTSSSILVGWAALWMAARDE